MFYEQINADCICRSVLQGPLERTLQPFHTSDLMIWPEGQYYAD